jgi:Na+/H+ antiporter NhaD/arsenite permease-like protein
VNVSFDHRFAVLAIFVVSYAALALGRIPGLRLNRTGIALLGAIATMLASGTPTAQTAASVNWPTIILLFGFFVISAQLRLSGFYDRVAVNLAAPLAHPNTFLFLLIAAAAVLSAALNNDVACYALTPVVGPALVRRGINPVPFLVAIAAASNVGAGATLIGNAQNMMIGSVAGLSFGRYLVWALPPVLFGLAVVFGVTLLACRQAPATPVAPAQLSEPELIPFNAYHTTKGLIILGGVLVLFFTPIPREITVLVAAGIHLLSAKFRTDQLLSLIDWPILLLFISLFVLSGTFQATGYTEAMVRWMQGHHFSGASPGEEVALTAGLSVLISNSPAVMLLIRLVPLAPPVHAYVMALSNSFAGNAIVTASVANLIVVQQAHHAGIPLSFLQFLRLGLPITALTLLGLVAWAHLAG